MLKIERKKIVAISVAVIIAVGAFSAFVLTNKQNRQQAGSFVSGFSLARRKPQYHKGENVTVNTTEKEARKMSSDAAKGKKDNPISKGKTVVIHHKDGSTETISKGATTIDPPKMKKNDPRIPAVHNGIWSVKRGNKTYTASVDKLHSLRDSLHIPAKDMHFPDATLFSYYVYAQEHNISFKKAYQLLGTSND